MSCFIYSTAPTVDFTTRYQHEKLSCQWKAQHHKSGEALSTSHLGQLKSHRVETASQTCQTGKIILSQNSINLSFITFSFITLTIDVLILIPARPAIYFSLVDKKDGEILQTNKGAAKQAKVCPFFISPTAPEAPHPIPVRIEISNDMKSSRDKKTQT